jgi:hypothetical protein
LIIDKIRIDKKMKHRLCATIDQDNLCINRWHNENDDKNNIGLEDKKDQTERNSTYKECILEYLLVCTKCKEQTGYSYPLFALQNAWEHILNTEHNVVTILEIVYDRGIIHENKRVKIELMIK